MKNKNVLISALILCFASLTGLAQVIDNKLDVNVEYLFGAFHGNEIYQDKNFKYPSLYNNFEEFRGFSLKILRANKQLLSFGIEATYMKASEWNSKDYSDFQRSEVKISYLSPILQFHSKFSQSGLLNRGRFFMEIAPNIGLSNVALNDTLFVVQTSNKTKLPPFNSRDFMGGIKVKAGIEYSLSNYTGLVASYSLQHIWVKSKYYNDRQFTCSLISFGLVFKFKKDKRFTYR